jgi:SPP1 family predicted phage head-tail adaptor
MIGAGERNKQIAIQEKAISTDSIGNQTETWHTIATVWAAIQPLSGREYWAARQVNAETTTKVTILYRRGVTAEHRILYGSRVFELTAPPINTSEANAELVLLAKEVAH